MIPLYHVKKVYVLKVNIINNFVCPLLVGISLKLFNFWLTTKTRPQKYSKRTKSRRQ